MIGYAFLSSDLIFMSFTFSQPPTFINPFPLNKLVDIIIALFKYCFSILNEKQFAELAETLPNKGDSSLNSVSSSS